MARAALRWRVDNLAELSGLSWARVQQMERATSISATNSDNLEVVRRVLEEAGICFLGPEKEMGEGVRLVPAASPNQVQD